MPTESSGCGARTASYSNKQANKMRRHKRQCRLDYDGVLYLRCTVCGNFKAENEFHKQQRGSYGHRAACKECIRHDNSARYVKERKTARRYRMGKCFNVVLAGRKFRKCTGCGITKPHSEFWKNLSMSYGISPRCKICDRKKERAKLGKQAIKTLQRQAKRFRQLVIIIQQ